MTGISLHMQWPLTSHLQGSFLKDNIFFHYGSNSIYTLQKQAKRQLSMPRTPIGPHRVMTSSCCPGIAKLPVWRGVVGTASAPDPEGVAGVTSSSAAATVGVGGAAVMGVSGMLVLRRLFLAFFFCSAAASTFDLGPISLIRYGLNLRILICIQGSTTNSFKLG
jgi:hypothetical protein